MALTTSLREVSWFDDATTSQLFDAPTAVPGLTVPTSRKLLLAPDATLASVYVPWTTAVVTSVVPADPARYCTPKPLLGPGPLIRKLSSVLLVLTTRMSKVIAWPRRTFAVTDWWRPLVLCTPPPMYVLALAFLICASGW